MNHYKNVAKICFFLTAFGILSGCGTVQGIGKDVSRTGHEIQKAAR